MPQPNNRKMPRRDEIFPTPHFVSFAQAVLYRLAGIDGGSHCSHAGIDLRENKAMVAKPWVRLADGVALDVRVTPRSERDAIEGVEYRADGRAVLKARVRAAPFEGGANDALRRLIARELRVAARQVEIASGANARLKRLRIVGDVQMLDATLGRLTAARS